VWPVFPGYRTAPPEFNIAREVLDHQIEISGLGDQPALRFSEGELTFKDLRCHVDALAYGLQESGVAEGERVLLRGPNSPEWVTAFLALVKLGALPVLVNTLLGPREICEVLTNSQIQRVIVDAEAAEAVRQAWSTPNDRRAIVVIGKPERGECAIEQFMRPTQQPLSAVRTHRDAPAYVAYTSGSTGRPKGVVHAHRWLIAVGDMARLRGETFAPGEVTLGVGELSNVGALGHCLLFPLRGGACASLLRGRASTDRILNSIKAFKPTIFFGVASVFRKLLAIQESERDKSVMASIRISISGGEVAGPTLPVEWEQRFGTPLYEHYALSEFQMVLANGPGVPVRPGSAGIALPGVGVEVLDATLRTARPGEIGDLAIRCDDPGLFLTYHNQPDLWRRSMRAGWFITGDLFSRDADGYFWFAGRADDTFKSRGYLIVPLEIENVIREHPAVAEVVVVGVLDEQISRAIKAVVVLRDDRTPSDELTLDLQEYVRSKLAPFKVPKNFEFRDELPRVGAIGKINRRLLEEDRQVNR
jgi:acyl-coenzyme A synthetase/AMP-(fatty) acid ligase